MLPCSTFAPALKLPCPLTPCPAEGIATSYTTTSTGITFYLDTRTGFDWQGAKRQCNLRGGHLAMYSSWQEQREVESYYQDNVRGLHGQRFVACCMHSCLHSISGGGEQGADRWDHIRELFCQQACQVVAAGL